MRHFVMRSSSQSFKSQLKGSSDGLELSSESFLAHTGVMGDVNSGFSEILSLASRSDITQAEKVAWPVFRW